MFFTKLAMALRPYDYAPKYACDQNKDSQETLFVLLSHQSTGLAKKACQSCSIEPELLLTRLAGLTPTRLKKKENNGIEIASSKEELFHSFSYKNKYECTVGKFVIQSLSNGFVNCFIRLHTLDKISLEVCYKILSAFSVNVGLFTTKEVCPNNSMEASKNSTCLLYFKCSSSSISKVSTLCTF